MSMFSRRGASRRSLLTALGAAAIGVSFSACSRPGGAPAGGGEEPKLNFYNWDTYIGETTLSDFKTASGVDVNMSLFATNDELFAKLKAGNPGFDVIVPSNEFVTRMTEAKLIQPLDHSKIPNLKNVDPSFMNPDFDPGRKMSIPYTWLVLGIGYRKSKVKGVPDSWKWLFDSDAYKNRIALLSESADLIRLAAKYKGHSVNNIPPELVVEIEKMLVRQKPNIKAFHEDNGQDMLLSGDVDLVLEYNGDIAQIMTEDPDIGFVVPKEGSLLNSDTLCIPVGAPRPNNAHAFINYLLDAEAGKKISETILYPTPNAAAKALMPADYRANPVIFPPADVLAKCEYGAFEGAEKASLYEEVITRVRAA
ncbi:MAG: spermidine/putrescine ABC transporter substrate-binding protein [Phenylobacterium sp.]|uniref:ABC transporter substrate-binding protein n=2 Tax=Phenylobacterium sp. TaxID=1871053 RepID=UPI0025E65296|nr:spermidine/putrescine ABC transporter substrate-binding protein [Phenylobacterium sp.]MCA6225042.1 spermidine/putrescine ABC transporter substrate-binding protein [Phenylobacterium sp.]MCA6226414.1 spermidine/putrescine ABC transporter substrate-binding protein [Phenylobacterium sp.]MCA6231801.1 spermidine/putrescine ABC transporter substrate-binding protein [Phenylobacterium sp.]MCA6235364.1 spermidine/putrescine ABC transporter substrate-binding protein [Phenylobacterium sp.]MCA6249612.1 